METSKQTKATVVILIPDKTDLKKKIIKQNRNRRINIENILMVARWERGWETG